MREFLYAVLILTALGAGSVHAGVGGRPVVLEDSSTQPTTVDAGTDRSVFVGQPVTLSADANLGFALVTLWADAFDVYPSGPLSPPWFDQSTGSNYAEISSSIFRGAAGKSLHLYDASVVDGANAYRSLPNPDHVDLTVWMRAATTSGAGTLVINSPSAWATVRAGMGPNGLFIYDVCAGSYSSTAMSYATGTWYEVRLVADVATDTYDMYVNGSPIVSGAPFCVSAGSLNGVVLNSGGSQSGEFYFDDISTQTLQPIQVLEYRWDLDGSVDNDLDGNRTNDTDLSGPTVTTTYVVPALYLVTVTILDSTMSFANDTLWVTVRSPPSTSTIMSAGANVSLNEGQSFTPAPVVAPGSAWKHLWTDGFDAYPPGPLVTPWTDRSTGPNVASISSSVHRGPSGRSIQLSDSSILDGANAERRWTGAPTAVDVTAWIYPTSTSALGTIVVNSDSRWGAVRAGLGPGGSFIYDVCGPTYSSLPKVYSASVWYELRIVADAATDRYDMYINGSLAVSQAPFCGVVDMLDYVWLNAGGDSVGNFYVDDVTTWALITDSASSYSWDIDGSLDADGDGNSTNDPDAAGASPVMTFGDNGDYLVTLTVTMEDGRRQNASLLVSTANLAPVVVPLVPPVVSISTGVLAVAQMWDPGSDDLHIEWGWTDGAFESRDYLNGVGVDPPQSPQGLFPFFVNDTTIRGFASPGAYGISIRADDDDGATWWANRTVDVRDVPLTVATVGQPRYFGGRLYINSSTPISLSATDRSGFGIGATFYRVDGGAVQNYTGPVMIGTAGLRNITFWSADLLGGVESPRSLEVHVDASPPVTILEVQGPHLVIGSTHWLIPASALWLNSTDGESGLRETLARTHVDAVWSSWARVSGPLSPPVADGPFGIEYYGVDNLGQPGPVDSASFSVDSTPPSSSLVVGVPTTGGWVTGATFLSVQASDAGTGVSASRYRMWHGGSWSPFVLYRGPFTLSDGEGPYFVEFYSEDEIGNREAVRNATLSVDDSPPNTLIELAGAQVQVSGTLWVVPSIDIWLNASDEGVGWSVTLYRFSTEGSWTPWAPVTGVLLPPLTAGFFQMEFYSADRLGNLEPVLSLSLAVDGTPPVSTARSGTPSSGQWITSQTQITIEADDGPGVGVAFTRFRTWHGGVYSPFGPYTSPFRLLQSEGTNNLEVESGDLLGNLESLRFITFDVDDTPPEIEHRIRQRSDAHEFSVEASASDSGSGLGSLEYRIDQGDWRHYAGVLTVRGDSSVVIEFRATDLLGNVAVEALPPVRPEYVNLKPLLSVLLALTILVFTLLSYRQGNRSARVLLVGAVFIGAELFCGVSSALWDVLLFPPWTGAGLAVNLGITAAGISGVRGVRRSAGATAKAGAGNPPSDIQHVPPPVPPE